MHIHLDAVGGIAGDMFTAALLDTWPELTEQVIATVRLAGLDEHVRLERTDFNDGVLTGSKFNVSLADEKHDTSKTVADEHQHGHPDSHHKHLSLIHI